MNYIDALNDPRPAFRREAERARDDIISGDAAYTVDAGGVMRWESNGSVPPAEWVALTAHLFPGTVDVARSTAARDAETASFLSAYRVARAARTAEEIAEERAEARAAMGPGVELVNVITGERWVS